MSHKLFAVRVHTTEKPASIPYVVSGYTFAMQADFGTIARMWSTGEYWKTPGACTPVARPDAWIQPGAAAIIQRKLIRQGNDFFIDPAATASPGVELTTLERTHTATCRSARTVSGPFRVQRDTSLPAFCPACKICAVDHLRVTPAPEAFRVVREADDPHGPH